MKKIVNFFTALMGFITIVCGLSHHIPGDYMSIFGFFSLLFPLSYILNILVLLLHKHIKIKLNIVAIIVTFPVASSFFSISHSKEITGVPHDLKVMSYNVRNGIIRNNNDHIPTQLDSLITKYTPDVLCLQEVYLQGISDAKSIEIGGAKYNLYHTASSNIILSKQPILGSGVIPFKETKNSAIYIDTKINGLPIRIYSCHLQSYKISANEYTSSDNSPISKNNLLHKIDIGIRQRAKQARAVRNNIEECNKPVIVCGDFNAMPSSYPYHVISKNLKDSFLERGKGYGATYHAGWIYARIDYILYSEQLDSKNYLTLEQGESDHKAIIGTYYIK